MIWIVSASKDIVENADQLNARTEYIKIVTGTEVTGWNKYTLHTSTSFFLCSSYDGVNGVFITAHINDVFELCSINCVYSSEFILANTCVYDNKLPRELLSRVMYCNSLVDILFAKQELSVYPNYILRQTVTLIDCGEFGFPTSRSERELFKKRDKGIKEAAYEAFWKVQVITL